MRRFQNVLLGVFVGVLVQSGTVSAGPARWRHAGAFVQDFTVGLGNRLDAHFHMVNEGGTSGLLRLGKIIGIRAQFTRRGLLGQVLESVEFPLACVAAILPAKPGASPLVQIRSFTLRSPLPLDVARWVGRHDASHLLTTFEVTTDFRFQQSRYRSKSRFLNSSGEVRGSDKSDQVAQPVAFYTTLGSEVTSLDRSDLLCR